MIKSDVLPHIQPMRLRLVREAFDDPDFIFELKHDGFRAVVYIEDQQCRLVSRNLRNLKFTSLKTALAKLPVNDVILDGEVVCLDQRGVSQFNQLLNRKTEPAFYAFDLLWLNGEDLRQLPLIERKARLGNFVRLAKEPRLLYAQHIETTGNQFFEEICANDLEGIVAKRKHSIYKDGGNSWLKIKNRAYTQAEGRRELLTRRKTHKQIPDGDLLVKLAGEDANGNERHDCNGKESCEYPAAHYDDISAHFRHSRVDGCLQWAAHVNQCPNNANRDCENDHNQKRRIE